MYWAVRRSTAAGVNFTSKPWKDLSTTLPVRSDLNRTCMTGARCCILCDLYSDYCIGLPVQLDGKPLPQLSVCDRHFRLILRVWYREQLCRSCRPLSRGREHPFSAGGIPNSVVPAKAVTQRGGCVGYSPRIGGSHSYLKAWLLSCSLPADHVDLDRVEERVLVRSAWACRRPVLTSTIMMWGYAPLTARHVYLDRVERQGSGSL